MTAQEKLEAARQIRAQIVRGDMMIGLMDFDELEQMFRLYREASQAGLAEASFEYAIALMGGEGEPPELELAVEAFATAAAQGYGREASLRRLRLAYFHDQELLDHDVVRAEIEALLQEDPDGEAALLRGYFQTGGFAYPKNLEEALAWHERAASKGNADAMFELYVLYSTGQGTEPNPELALDWVMRAAEAGSVRAMYNLGTFYATGNGVDRDPVRSIAWYEKAAEAGHGRAAATVSVMYFTGDEVEQDLDAAESYFALAYDHGYDAVKLYLTMELDCPFV